tara:strand:- start:519 stop:794 length:276 start_codon:yes stop_codon:yes gene_type:complete
MEYMDSKINSEQFLLGFGTIKINNSQRMEIAAEIAESMLIAEHDADEYWTTPIHVMHENGDQTYTEYAQDIFADHYQNTLDKIDAVIGLGE